MIRVGDVIVIFLLIENAQSQVPINALVKKTGEPCLVGLNSFSQSALGSETAITKAFFPPRFSPVRLYSSPGFAALSSLVFSSSAHYPEI